MSTPPPEIGGARFYNTRAQTVLEENLPHLTETQKQDVLGLLTFILCYVEMSVMPLV